MIVNGEKISINALTGPGIDELLNHFNLNKNRVAIEINGEVVKKSDYDSIKLTESDVIEIIHFVGGGI